MRTRDAGGTGPPAEQLVPLRPTIARAARAAADCRACRLYRDATQTVFGGGPASASVMLVGEQPGDAEDRQGHPFVGPAGRLLDGALDEAGIDRDDAYVTNVVKHFKFTRKGKRRIHKKPNAEEIRACRPWLDTEIRVVRPRIIVCLGATAAQALIDRSFRVSVERGRFLPTPLAEWITATVHPSAVLRAPDDEARRSERVALVRDLKRVAARLEEPPARMAAGG